jgi:hypothetical protein
MKLSKIISTKSELLSHLDPDRIYVENVRSFYNLPTRVAKFLCEMAVKQNFFEKWYGVMCPTCDRIVQSFKKKSEIPHEMKCSHCELLEKDTYIFTPSDINIKPFYKLRKRK